MLKVLNNIRSGINPYSDCHGRTRLFGRTLTLNALIKGGYLDAKYNLTEAGKKLLAAELFAADMR